MGPNVMSGITKFLPVQVTVVSVVVRSFCGKSRGLADFENTVDHQSAVIFDADSGLRLSYVGILSPKRNLDHRYFFSLV